MDMRINSKSHVPVHVQLEGQIKHLILTGNFEVGSRLPSIRAMAGFLRVNRNTVARVFSDLEREGYVESRRGSGVYVVEPPVEAEDLRRQEVLERVMDLAAAQGVLRGARDDGPRQPQHRGLPVSGGSAETSPPTRKE